ncbi:hypothetical protein DNK56_13335 [Streptomyces sp. AC1-42W]|nr:hypothetical protein DNK55_18105 [Streptomyces sp. AC1-42T]PZT83937.1 hypothetical protein DNK56_13335 [Streptomyces sp. AC1-42W]
MLRSRRARREEPLETGADALVLPGPGLGPARSGDPEEQALVADSVGLALLVVLETLDPAERLAFVLHDMFAVPFDEIAPIVDRTPAAARRLASRARRRVRGADPVPDPDAGRRREVVEAFLTAARGGDFEALLAGHAVHRRERADRGDVRDQRPGAAARPGPGPAGPLTRPAHRRDATDPDETNLSHPG